MESNNFGGNRFSEIDKVKQRLDSFRPFNPAALIKLKEALRVSEIYNSNAIEGNTLTLSETHILLETGLTIGGKPLKHHLEVINLSEAIYLIEDAVIKGKELNERVLKDLHYLVLKGTEPIQNSAGSYRKVPVMIQGASHIPPEPYLVDELMQNLFIWYEDNKNKIHPVELAAEFHYRLVYIHPFIDGNGRTSRLCLNLILMLNGLTPIIIEVKDRIEYIKYLDEVESKGIGNFVNFISNLSKKSLELHLTHLVPYDQL